MTDTTRRFDDHTVYALSDMADCGAPDSKDSAGAVFLRNVADAASEALDRIANGENANDVASEIAREAPDYRTYTRWQEFADLAAWQEDISEYGTPDAENLTDSVAGVALTIIAERLVNMLFEEASDDNDDD